METMAELPWGGLNAFFIPLLCLLFGFDCYC
jgi:hypothetical protein